MLKDHKKLGIALVAGLSLLLAAWAFLIFFVQFTSYTGEITKIDGNSLRMTGYYRSGKFKHLVDSLKVNRTVVVTPDTKITRERYYYPTREELDKDGGYSYQDLRKEFDQVTIKELTEDYNNEGIVLLVKSNKNILFQPSIKSTEIYYYFLVYPSSTN